MKHLIFSGYPNTRRTSIVTFTPFCQNMFKELKSNLQIKDEMSFSLARITDTEVSVGKEIQFFDMKFVDEDTIEASYYDDHRGHDDELMPIKKIIRLDNPFGEIPVLPGYEQLRKFFLVGEGFHQYNLFIEEVKEILSGQIGNDIQLRYKNDDKSFSVIHGTLKEVNKGNIFMEDYHELLVKDNKSINAVILVNRKKNHRFISEKGYLCWVCPALFDKTDRLDNGEVFGDKTVWNFLTEEIVV